MADKFEQLESIGRGSFGDVYRGRVKESGKEVAIKVIDLEEREDDVDDIQREISMLAQCRSPFVTEYHCSMLIPGSSLLWIVMEYMAGGSVSDIMEEGALDEQSIGYILAALLNALVYLHGEGKIHRDIKAANVLLTSEGEVKVADFGVSGQLTHTLGAKRNTFVGTPFWMAPEVIQQNEGYNESADIWSLGITAIEMAMGAPPHADLHPMRVLFLIPKSPPPQLAGHFSKPFKEFVSMCLKHDPAERPTASDLLKHRFLKGVKKTEVLAQRARRRQEKVVAQGVGVYRTLSGAAGAPGGTWDFQRGGGQAGGGVSSPGSSIAGRSEDALAAGGTGTVRSKAIPGGGGGMSDLLPEAEDERRGEEGQPERVQSMAALREILVPSLVEVGSKGAAGAEAAGGAEAAEVAVQALLHMEQTAPGSSRMIVLEIMRRMGASGAPELQALREEGGRKLGVVMADGRSGAAPLSPLGAFLLSRWQQQVQGET